MKAKVHNLIILDESGSMGSVLLPTISGFNELMDNIRLSAEQFPDQEHRVSFLTFNSSGKNWIAENAVPGNIQKLTRENYRPNCDTPLYDAIGFSCNKIRTWMELGTKVLVSILSDGHENASVEFRRHEIRQLVENLENEGWTFTYMGTDHDVLSASMEINIKNTMEFSKSAEGMEEMFRKERSSRDFYYQKIRDKKFDELKEGYFGEDKS